MTAIGTLVECIEDMEIVNLKVDFYEGVLYTALFGEKIVVIDREHNPVELTEQIFQKHFKTK